jgi:hypothetical protein
VERGGGEAAVRAKSRGAGCQLTLGKRRSVARDEGRAGGGRAAQHRSSNVQGIYVRTARDET